MYDVAIVCQAEPTGVLGRFPRPLLHFGRSTSLAPVNRASDRAVVYVTRRNRDLTE